MDKICSMHFSKPPVSNFAKSYVLKYAYPSIERLNPVFTRRISSYVDKIRKQQNLKDSNKIPDIFYQSGDFICFSKTPKKVLVKRYTLPDGSKRLNLHRQSYQDVTGLGLNARKDSVFLNVDSNTKCNFALEVSNSNGLIEYIEKKCEAKFIEIRRSLFLLSKEESAVASQGISLLSWHKKAVHCPNCGNLLVNDGTSISKICESESCVKSKGGNRHHPPINPVGICLVSNESRSKTLLVRQPDHPPGMFTCIAGFIEVES